MDSSWAVGARKAAMVHIGFFCCAWRSICGEIGFHASAEMGVIELLISPLIVSYLSGVHGKAMLLK